MEYEYKDFPLTIFRDGEHILTDLTIYQEEHAKDGWEFRTMVRLPSNDSNCSEVVLSFRRPREDSLAHLQAN